MIAMRHNLFTIPFFVDEVDLKKITIIDKGQKPTFRSRVHTSLHCDKEITEDTMVYLSSIIARHIDSLGITYHRAEIGEIWRNTYTQSDFQEPHIHPFSQWSFIIYESVEKSKTVFLNPYRASVQTQMPMYKEFFVEEWCPELKAGSIIIFPSFIEHYVLSGNTGSTIAGNVFLTMSWEN